VRARRGAVMVCFTRTKYNTISPPKDLMANLKPRHHHHPTGRRPHRRHPHRLHRLLPGGRRLDGAPPGAVRPVHAHLPAQPLVPPADVPRPRWVLGGGAGPWAAAGLGTVRVRSLGRYCVIIYQTNQPDQPTDQPTNPPTHSRPLHPRPRRHPQPGVVLLRRQGAHRAAPGRRRPHPSVKVADAHGDLHHGLQHGLVRVGAAEPGVERAQGAERGGAVTRCGASGDTVGGL
jgi:hypothetical protein